MKIFPMLLLSLGLPLSPMAAEIYSWVDANGVKHFSQESPPKGVPFNRISVAESGAASPLRSPSADSARKTDTPLGGGPKTRDAGLALKAETLERCAKARERITYLEEKTARRLFKTGPDGEPARYTEEDFNAELKKARDQEAANCT